MRKSNSSGGGSVDQQPREPLARRNQEAQRHGAVEKPTCSGGLRLRGIVTQRSKRALKGDLELVTYNVSSEHGSHLVEDFTGPGGPYLSLGEEIDLEVIVRTFIDKSQLPRSRLRIARTLGEF